MAAGTLPFPGTPAGPCIETCLHRDCGQTVAMADTPCLRCGEPIGYGTPFYQTPGGLVHAPCEEDAASEAQWEAASS